MREILFRGKRVDNGEWVMGCYIQGANGEAYITAYKYVPCLYGFNEKTTLPVSSPYDDNWVPLMNIGVFEVDPTTVGQYTGLTDKKKVSVWENDVMEFDAYGHHYRGKVSVIDGNFSIVCSPPNAPCDASPFLDDAIKRYGAVVIGNTADNPELLPN